jgi:RNA polymerase sigma-70 factor (ECF subfamily)
MQTDLRDDLSASLNRFIAARVRDPHAAQDIAQDVLLKLHQQVDAVPEEEKLPAWIFAVARNAIIDYRRRNSVRDHATLDRTEVPTESAEPDAVAELAPCITRMVEHLAEPYRSALKLVDLEGTTQQELADRESISLSAAKSRVQRARRQLRAMSHDCCNIEQNARGELVDFQTTERSGGYCGDENGEPRCGK